MMDAMTQEKRRERYEFILRYLSKPEVADGLSENDLDWAIKMQESFERKGFLSDRESEILENIWERSR